MFYVTTADGLATSTMMEHSDLVGKQVVCKTLARESSNEYGLRLSDGTKIIVKDCALLQITPEGDVIGL